MLCPARWADLNNGLRNGQFVAGSLDYLADGGKYRFVLSGKGVIQTLTVKAVFLGRCRSFSVSLPDLPER